MFWNTIINAKKFAAGAATLLLLLLGGTILTAAQEGGNASTYGKSPERANASTYGTQAQRPRVYSSGVLTTLEPKDATAAYFLEALVLMNLKADEYTVSFGVAQEGKTALESEQKVDQLIAQFTSSLNGLGIQSGDTFVDFISQNPIYEYAGAASGKTATEKAAGFQTKKNIIVRYKDRNLLRRITNAANQASIFDVIKIDYVVKDIAGMRSRMLDEATKIIKQKEQLFNVLNLKLRPVAVVFEQFQTFNPDDLYQTYTAYESGDVEGYRRVIEKRKSSTSYYEPLDANDFDLAINPIGIEPVVQSTLYLRIKYLPVENATAAPK